MGWSRIWVLKTKNKIIYPHIYRTYKFGSIALLLLLGGRGGVFLSICWHSLTPPRFYCVCLSVYLVICRVRHSMIRIVHNSSSSILFLRRLYFQIRIFLKSNVYRFQLILNKYTINYDNLKKIIPTYRIIECQTLCVFVCQWG